MEKARPLDYGQMDRGPKNHECRARGHQILDPKVVTSEEVIASLMTQPTLAPRQGWASVADTSRTLTVLFCSL